MRSLGKLNLEVSTDGWRFPAVQDSAPPPPLTAAAPKLPVAPGESWPMSPALPANGGTKIRPTQDNLALKERLLYLLQPPLENVFGGRQVHVPFKPYPYQLEGIAFLMPRNAALLADEMGLGKTMQTILALRLLFLRPQCRAFGLSCRWWATGRGVHAWAEDLPLR